MGRKDFKSCVFLANSEQHFLFKRFQEFILASNQSSSKTINEIDLSQPDMI